MKLLNECYRAIASMNEGLAQEDKEVAFFSIELVPGTTDYSEFHIFYGTNMGKLLFCSQENLSLPEDHPEKKTVLQQICEIWIKDIQLPIAKIKAEPYEVNSETKMLISMIPEFLQAMKNRLIRKSHQGYTGWMNNSTADVVAEIYRRLKRLEAGEAWVDIGIANWALINYANRVGLGESTLVNNTAFTPPSEAETAKGPILFYKRGDQDREKPYRKIMDSKIKLEGVLYALRSKIGNSFMTKEQFLSLKDEWLPVVIYEALYENPDGRFWVRTPMNFEDKMYTELEMLKMEEENKQSEDTEKKEEPKENKGRRRVAIRAATEEAQEEFEAAVATHFQNQEVLEDTVIAHVSNPTEETKDDSSQSDL